MKASIGPKQTMMKYTILFILSLFKISTLLCQESSWENYEASENYKVVVFAINYDSLDNKTLFIYNESDTFFLSKFVRNHLKLVDSNGKVLKEISLKIDSLEVNQLFSGFYNKFSNNFHLFGGASVSRGKGRTYFVHYILDVNLQVISVELIKLREYYPVLHLECTETLDSGYICSAVQSNQFNDESTKDTMNGNIIKIVGSKAELKRIYLSNLLRNIMWNIRQLPFDKKYYGFSYGIHAISDDFKSSIHLDKNNQPIFTSTNLVDTKIFNEKLLISSLRYTVPQELNEFAYFFGYLDNNFKLKEANGIGKYLVTAPLISQQIDFKFQNKLYAADHEQTVGQFGPFRYFNLGLFDDKLKKVWQISYGLNIGRRFRPIGITATYDGGVIVYGSLISAINNKAHSDPFYIKFDCKGQVVATENIDKEDIVSIKQYPNPASDFINIEVTGISYPAHITISDMNGKIIDKKTMHSESIEVDISSYPKGMYNFTLSNEKFALIGSKSFVKI